MKIVVVLLSLLFLSSSFAQNVQITNPSNKFFIGTSFKSNINGAKNIGMGLRLSAGYNLNENLTFLISTGYMTNYTDPQSFIQQRTYEYTIDDYIVTKNSFGRKDHKFIPIDFSFRFNFDLWGVQPYAELLVGWDYNLNSGNYSYSSETRIESTNELLQSTNGIYNELYNSPKTGFSALRTGLGLGVIVPVTGQLRLDLSYQFMSGNNSIGIGMNYNIK
jgi:hypothetical protein